MNYFEKLISNDIFTEQDYKTISIDEVLELITRFRLLAKCDSKYCVTPAVLHFILNPFKFKDYSKEQMKDFWMKETPQIYSIAKELTFKDIRRELHELKNNINKDYTSATYENACKFNDLARRYNYIINSFLYKDREFLDEYDLKLRELI